MRAVSALVLALLLVGVALPSASSAGEDVVVAILDSGIDPTHAQFRAGQVVGWKDFVANRALPYDDHGHGTAVASRAAGLTLGASPGASLLVGKVLDANNSTPWTRLAQAVRWAADQGADVISVSIWSAQPNPTGSPSLAAAIDHATDKGALVVWIAGNGGSPPLPATVLVGASSPQALVVGAADESGRRWESSLSSGSQRDPEVLAWGHRVPVAIRGGGVGLGTGTSYAAPWVAGAAAELLEAGAPRDPAWLKWVLLHAARDDPMASYLDEGYGFLSFDELESAKAVARGEAPVPGPDGRDAFHLATAAARVATSGGQTPSGAAPP